MDEQHDQAVLQIEEIETDTEYDYLSILREMQQSLNADDEFSASLKATEETANLAFETDLEAPPLETYLRAGNDNFEGQESDQAANYFADAKTQPLPELPADFINNLKSENLDLSGKTEVNSDDFLADSAENSFSSEVVALKTHEMTDFEENPVALEVDDQPFDDFAELSPILFDANERLETAEPNFDLELSALTQTSPEPAMDDSSANLPVNQMEPAMDDLPAMADEMPMNLAFGEMFVEDTVEDTIESPAKFAPPIEIDEETESEFASLLERFETGNSAAPSSFQEPVSPTFEQNLNEQNLPINFATNNGGMPVNNDDFALPEAMLLGQDEGGLAPEPSFALPDLDHQEPADEMMIELPQLPVSSAETLNSSDLILAIPSFLQAELVAAKQPAAAAAADESLLEEPFSTQNPIDTTEDLAPEPKTLASDYLAVPLITENDPNKAFEGVNRAAEPSAANGGIGSNKYIADDEAEEMPETALFESLATLELPEIDFPEDLPENSSPSAFPAIKEGDSRLSEMTLAGSTTLAAPEQDAVGQNLRQEMSDITKSVSFLNERFVIFKLDDTLYAFPAINVAEIGQLLPITPLPFVPSWFLGISNLRGGILSVVGLRELWEKNSASPHKSKILIVHSEKLALTIGLVVDAVREMRHVRPEEIFSDDSQNEIESHFAPYKIGMVEYEGQNLCLLNAEKLLETLKR